MDLCGPRTRRSRTFRPRFSPSVGGGGCTQGESRRLALRRPTLVVARVPKVRHRMRGNFTLTRKQGGWGVLPPRGRPQLRVVDGGEGAIPPRERPQLRVVSGGERDAAASVDGSWWGEGERDTKRGVTSFASRRCAVVEAGKAKDGETCDCCCGDRKFAAVNVGSV